MTRSTVRCLPGPLFVSVSVRLFVYAGRAVRVLRARWSRCNPVHNSPTVRVSQMCSVFLHDGVEWRKKIKGILFPLCKTAHAVFPSRKWTPWVLVMETPGFLSSGILGTSWAVG